MVVYSQQLQVYYVNNDPEVNDKLYVRWIGGVRFLPPETAALSIFECWCSLMLPIFFNFEAWSNRQSKECLETLEW